MTETMAAVRSNLSELAALLQEFRVTWRTLDWPERDRMRRMALEALSRFRAQQDRALPAAPADCPWDVSGLVDASREQLLSALRDARFNEAQLRERLARTMSGADAQQADIRSALARCGALISRTRKTVPMEALRAAVYGEES
jgi:hypothetical protein